MASGFREGAVRVQEERFVMGKAVRTWSMVHSEFYRRRYGQAGQVRPAARIRIVAGQATEVRGVVVKAIRPSGAQAA